MARSQQGRNAEAFELMRTALKANPQSPGALSNCGLMLHRLGRLEEALATYDKVLAIKADFAGAHFNRAVIFSDLNRFEDSLESYDKAVAIEPRHAEAHFNRGIALSRLKRFDEALASYDNALAINPAFPAALTNRANTLRDLKRFDAALMSFDSLLAKAPNDAEAHYYRGAVLSEMKRFEEALTCYDRALALKPHFAPALASRGGALLGLMRFADALASYDKALALEPVSPTMQLNRGVALWNLGRLEEALACYNRTLGLSPRHAEAHYNRGIVLADMQHFAEALASFDQALEVYPDHAETWNGRGSALWNLAQFEDSLQSFNRALEINPDFAEALYNRSNVQWTQFKNYDLAVRDLEKLVAIAPDHDYARGELLHLRMLGGDWRDLAREAARIDDGVRAGKRVVKPFVYQAISELPADLQACARIASCHMFPAVGIPPAPLRDHKKIRLGYVSGEFHEQATAFLAAGLYELHDKSKFELVALDNGWNDGSPLRKRLEAAFDKFIDISALTDAAAAQTIIAEEIDILVNLNGYFGKMRMGIFARRAAPIQVNYLGFPGTLGADYIDYIIADRMVIPEDERQFYTEAVAYLPDSYQVNDAKRPIADQIPSRSDCGLPDRGFVFCCFNQIYKLTPEMFAIWMRLLRQVDGSAMWMLESNNTFVENLRREADAQGIAENRLIFAPGLQNAKHLARLKQADLFLDSLPYNAHTTASDALWAGLPLVTCRGQAFAGRVAASLLQAVGLPELVTENLQDYETLALKLARDGALLQSLRQKLQQNRLTQPLFNTDLFRRNIETAYETMIEIRRRGEVARGFSV